MKRIHYLQLMLGALCCTSCIEEYNELPSGQAEPMVVIDGQIVSDRECTFSLFWSAPLGTESLNAFQPIRHASVVVEGTDGQRFVGHEGQNPGHYTVPVGELSADQEYFVQIALDSVGTFQSQPMRPIDTPDIAEFSYEQPRQDRQIDFMISTADPQSPTCFLWEYDETWEIYTPSTAYWYYWYKQVEGPDPLHPAYEGEFRPIEPTNLTNHGWCTFTGMESVFASNEDYGNGAISKLCLFQRHPNDNRFQHRYLARVRQMAISQQEYEYRRLVATQSTEMGGLFTPMPSELPSNITSQQGRARAIGFIGVRGKVCETGIYVHRDDVGHRDLYRVELVPDSLVQEPVPMLKLGYRVIDYDPYSGVAHWGERWIIDCTDAFWSASLRRPDYWRDENE